MAERGRGHEQLLRVTRQRTSAGASADAGAAGASRSDRDPPSPPASPQSGRIGVGRGHRLDVGVMECIVWQYHFLGFSFDYIASIMRTSDNTISATTVRSVIQRFDKTGIVDYAPREKPVTKMSDETLDVLLAIVAEQPWLYLSEMAEELFWKTGRRFSREYVHAALHQRAGFSLKKMQIVAGQRDEANRSLYWTAVQEIGTRPGQFFFGDESGFDNKTARRKMGWGCRGSRVNVEEILHRGKHYSILALFGVDGFISLRWVEGGYDTGWFMQHITEMIAQVMSEYPADRSILVLDNCRIHRAEEDALRAVIRAVGQAPGSPPWPAPEPGEREIHGGRLLFLAPYSPVDSPIEFGFSVVKNSWRRNCAYLGTLDVSDAIDWVFANAYRDTTVDGPAATFRHCGYSEEQLKPW